MRFKHGPPHELMREWLEVARDAGQSFDEAWSAALETPSQPHVGIHLPHMTEERKAWLAAFAATKDEWEAAWHGRETRVSRALREWRDRAEDASEDARRVLLSDHGEARMASGDVPHYERPSELQRRIAA